MKRSVIASLILTLAACGTVPPEESKIHIGVTIYPLEFIASAIGGDSIELIKILPPGAEAHSFEPTPKTIAALRDAKIFIFNGGEIDTWAERIAPELKKDGTTIVRMSDHVSPFETDDGIDPHFWLDPLRMLDMVWILEKRFSEIDPASENSYKANARALRKKLEGLHAEYIKELTSCKLDTVISSHNAYRYLSERYGFTYVPLAGISHEEEPSPRHLAEVTDAIKEKGIKIILVESLPEDRFSATVGRETGASFEVLSPIETVTESQRSQAKDYLTIMDDNLNALSKALQCPS